MKNQVPTPEYKVAVKQEAPPPALGKINRKARRGYYLATIGHCMECHSPREKGVSLVATQMGVGKHEFKGPWGVSTSRNITSDKEKGLGSWTDAEIKRAITTGVSRNGDKLKPPMGFAGLRQDDRQGHERPDRLSAHGAGEAIAKPLKLRSFPRRREPSFLALRPRFRGDERCGVGPTATASSCARVLRSAL